MISPRDFGLPGKFSQFRPKQLETAAKASSAKKYGFLIEGPTGCGKSLVAATAQRLAGKNTAYIVITKQLQQQILDDFPYAKTIMGRANYDCLLMEGYTADLCVDSKSFPCDLKSDCPYLVAKREAQFAPLAVLNAAYFLTESNFVGGFKDIPVLVCDEVDQLEDELMNFIELSISTRQLARWNLTAPQYKTKHESWLEWAKKAVEELRPHVQKDLSSLPIRELRMQKDLKALISKLEFFIKNVDEHWVWERAELGWAFKPIWVSRYSSMVMWNKATKMIGMSATVLDPGQISRNLGLKDYEYHVLDSPFPPEARPIYFQPYGDLARGRMETELPKICEGVERIMKMHPDVKILVHTVSYKVRDYLLDNLTQKARLVTHTTADRAEKLEQFKTSKLPLVLLSPSMERGVDLPYDACRVVVIAKVPYPSLESKQVSARLHASKDGQSWYSHRTVSSLIQATGRGMRSADDTCDVYILDRQFDRLYSNNKALFPVHWRKSLKF